MIPGFLRLRAFFALLVFATLQFASMPRAWTADGPELPSEKTASYENAILRMRYPDNWKLSGQGNSFNLAPDDGLVYQIKGPPSVAYGVVVDLFAASDTIGRKLSLDDATGQLIRSLERGNPDLRVSGASEHMKVTGRDSLLTHMTNDSPQGGKETDWLVTTKQEDAVLYFVFVAPEAAFSSYEGTFKSILASIRWRH